MQVHVHTTDIYIYMYTIERGTAGGVRKRNVLVKGKKDMYCNW